MQVYELVTCVRRPNENTRNLISLVQFLINIYHHSQKECFQCLFLAPLFFIFVEFVRPATAAGNARITGKQAAVATRINGNQIVISAYQKQAMNHQKSRLCGHLFTQFGIRAGFLAICCHGFSKIKNFPQYHENLQLTKEFPLQVIENCHHLSVSKKSRISRYVSDKKKNQRNRKGKMDLKNSVFHIKTSTPTDNRCFN